MSELPQGWETVNLGKVAEFEMGQAPPGAFCNKEGNGTVFVKAGEFGIDHPQVREWTTKPLKFAHRGDVLICVVGATSGKLNLGIDCAIGRSVAAIRPSVAASQKIIYRQLQLQVAQLRADSSGTAQGVISKQMLADIQLVLPPVSEQTRIAKQLDTLLTRVQTCNDRFDAIPALLKRFRQTVLDAATTGRLTEDWRGLDDLDQGEWKTVALQDVITEMRNGLAQKPAESPPGSKILRIGAVRSGQLNLDDHRYLVVSDKEAEQYALKQDDLLFTRYNGSLEFVGVCAALTHDAPGYVYPDKLIRVRVRADRAIAKFIEIVFGCRRMRTQVESFVKSSAGQRGVSGADLKAAKFSLPPITEQAEIVRRAEALFALADRIEARCTAARTQAQRLTPLVLAKAFRGELVPQDPNDEPASALLARIASSNTAVAGKNKQKAPVVRNERAQAAINL